MITELHHLRFGESAQLRGHHVARFVTGYEVDGARAVSREEAEARLGGGVSEEAVREALAPYKLQLPADRAGREKLAKSLGRYIGEEGRALCALVTALLEETRHGA